MRENLRWKPQSTYNFILQETPHHCYSIPLIKSKSITLPNSEEKESLQWWEYQEGVIGDYLTDLQLHTMSCISLNVQMRKLIFLENFKLSKFMPLINGARMSVKINEWQYNKQKHFCTAKEAKREWWGGIQTRRKYLQTVYQIKG